MLKGNGGASILSATSTAENDFLVQVSSFLMGMFFVAVGWLLLYRHSKALISLESGCIYSLNTV